MAEKLGTLFQLYYRPSRALSTILDSGSLALAVIAAAALGLAMGEISRVVLIAVLFAPACIAIISVWDHLGSLGVVLRRDYSPLLVCTLMCWIAANIPAWLASFLAPAVSFWIHFGCGRVFPGPGGHRDSHGIWDRHRESDRNRFRRRGCERGRLLRLCDLWRNALLFHLSAGSHLALFPVPSESRYVHGPGGGLRSRQNFNRHLEALTVNPRDSDAHYQLGLIYQQRRNYTEAISRFTKAVEIDPGETDAHHQLGVIALEQKRYEDARRHFAATLALDDKHSSSEAWRGLGAADFQLGNTEQALAELQKYTERREFDPEGQYWLGEAFKKLGRLAEAKALSSARWKQPAHLRLIAGDLHLLGAARLKPNCGRFRHRSSLRAGQPLTGLARVIERRCLQRPSRQRDPERRAKHAGPWISQARLPSQILKLSPPKRRLHRNRPIVHGHRIPAQNRPAPGDEVIRDRIPLQVDHQDRFARHLAEVPQQLHHLVIRK